MGVKPALLRDDLCTWTAAGPITGLPLRLSVSSGLLENGDRGLRARPVASAATAVHL